MSYIVMVYAPAWFQIRRENNFIKHIFKKMIIIRLMGEDVQRVVKPVINRNNWFATPGNLMCAMRSSKEKEVRQRVVIMLLKNRKKPPKKPRKKVLQGMRQLQVPQLQWDADHWSKIMTY